MTAEQKKYDELCELARKNACLKSTLALVEWDQQTQLPSGSGAYRAEQLTFLAGEVHKRETDARLGDLLTELSTSDLAADPFSDTGATIREMKRVYEKKSRLPADLVEAQARAHSLGQQSWIEARKDNRFSLFAGNLKQVFDLKREEADAVGFDDCRYDVLLDDFEPGAKTADVEQVLTDLRNELVPLISEIGESTHRPDGTIVKRHFPRASQEIFCREASSRIGFDYERGRLDIAHHPFCQEVGPDDVRITTRYDENFFSPAFFGTLHEAGHGIYEQGLRGEMYGMPPGSYCSLGIHESQSRLWENLVGRSASFWQYFFSRAVELFPQALGDVSEEQFFGSVNEVQPSLIRVEADQATYDLHIIVRFELERAVLDGELDTDDLPGAWNEKYQSYLGIQPPTDTLGVLQDIHWSCGLVGYFPTYSLGNLYASQIFEAAESELGSLPEMFSRGEYQPLKTWLNKTVHQAGNCLPAPELGRRISGKELSPAALIGQLRQKLGGIYRL